MLRTDANLVRLVFALVFGGLLLIPLLVTAQSNDEATSPLVRSNFGAAPELHQGNWLNTTEPLRLADLRGQVVLMEMWTFDCINCIRTLPYVQQWHETYADDGLVVIGNHYPEFNYERDLGNLRAAIDRLGVTYPVLQDNGRQTWAAYNNRYWPTMYLIDKNGDIRYKHIGEGRYSETENAIRALLAEPYTPPVDAIEEQQPPSLTPTDVLRVRSGPGTDNAQIDIVHPNEAYYVLGETDGWYQILLDDRAAYVHGDYVTLNPQ